jgi:hypothetical protein
MSILLEDVNSLNFSSARLKTSIKNCTKWLKTNESNPTTSNVATKKKINLPDLSQPPPPLLISNYTTNPPLPPLPPLPPSTPPPPSLPLHHDLHQTAEGVKRMRTTYSPNSKYDINPSYNLVSSSSDGTSKSMQRERERDRSRRGLPNIRLEHLCSINYFIL